MRAVGGDVQVEGEAQGAGELEVAAIVAPEGSPQVQA